MDIQLGKYFEKITEILAQKKLLLNEMLALTEAQTDVIKPDSLDELQRLVNEKQQRIEAIDKFDDVFSMYFEKIKAAAGVDKLQDLDVSAYPAAKAAKDLTKEIISLLERIKEKETVNSEKSKRLYEQLGAQIKRINQGKLVNNAYKPVSSNIGSFFIDQKR